MHTPAKGSEAETGAPTAEPRHGEDTRYLYYMDREPTSLIEVFVCDHAYDCESLYREASEEEVLALIGADALRAAQDECAWNGLGSKRLLVYVKPTDEDGEGFHIVEGARERWVLPGTDQKPR